MDLEYIKSSSIKLLVAKSEDTEEYYAVGKSFMIDLLMGMAKLSVKYSQHQIIDFPYLYSERQLSSIILPTLSRLCNGAVLAELPARRCCCLKYHEKEDSFGRIDYWCIYKDYSIIIEVKHSFDAFLTEVTRERPVVKRWEYMTIDQLQSIKSEVKQYEEQTKGVIRLGLQFVVSYSDKRPTRALVNEYKSKLPDILYRLERDVCKCKPSITKPDFMACWFPPMQMILCEENTFPGLILMGKIFRPIQHKGSKEKTNL